MRFFTAGESHGKGIFAFVDGFPAGLKVDNDYINKLLFLRQGGYGRGGRQKIEKDQIDILSGIRKGITTGAPILIAVWNKDFREVKESFVPRPGHSDLAGALKYGIKDTRFISERASARETVGRVAVGALCELLLKEFQIELISFVTEIGGIRARIPEITDYSDFSRIIENSELYTPDSEAEAKMKEMIDAARRKKDTLGGVFEVRVKGVPPGLGSHTQWDKKLDGRIAQAVMSIQAIKGVEIGIGFEAARRFGSEVHDEIIIEDGKIKRASNRAGGTEGGMTNGNEIVVRAAMKPISTLYNPLRSVNLESLNQEPALVDRSDICAVPAASIVGRAAVAIEVTRAMIEKFGGDSLSEMLENYKNYIKRCENIQEWIK
ncbi:MAG: chorismate synthase [Candidatus Calescibacterium sp.]|nr:chorismate synthase [Candidatus Calescibacterium sp.]MCX7733504.1 chorismate synthase [bacterium]MDW8087217.1 chorismate synthase [Candidatus Calescibacterium sp.]